MHLAVLRRDADANVKVFGAGLHVPDDRTHLNRLGARAEDEE
jgi:hypothetical protein